MNISRDEWLKALGDAVKPDDPDALTVAEIARLFGLNDTAAYRRVRDLVAEKRAVRTYKTITMVSGHAKRVPAYRLVKGKK